MSSIGTGYDLSVTTFSPDGRVFQIEYAAKAVDNSGTVIGIKCKDGVVLVGCREAYSVENDASGFKQKNTLGSSSFWDGLAADGRQIVARAKSEATNYDSVYGEPIPVKELADRVASYVHLCTLYWWLRPFGCGVILGGYDRDGPQLYMVEPSGVSYRYFGAAIGKGRQAAKTEIEKLKLADMTCRQGVIEVAKIIYGVHDEAKDKDFELEMSWVCDDSNRQHVKDSRNMDFFSALLVGYFDFCLQILPPCEVEHAKPLASLAFASSYHWTVFILQLLLVPDDLLEEAKTAAKAALEEMDAD
ncbi:Proteasome subunit alpha type-3 [Vigna angularis]|uniref:Proteasome subunit alpha type-3 n=1 Tax=Phaseolus angularis TaxID=3914 RepID=A0A8T0JUR6_PHAAN|nr:Proteasome subunit alpha type-3 [Vigna angularis]